MSSKSAYITKTARAVRLVGKSVKSFKTKGDAAFAAKAHEAGRAERLAITQRSPENAKLLDELRTKKKVAPVSSSKSGGTISPKVQQEAKALAASNKPVIKTPTATPISNAPAVQQSKGIGDHFKKHWPAYAVAGGVGAAGYHMMKNKNKPVQSSIPE